MVHSLQDLIESLQVHAWHLMSVSERLSISAEELAHTHRAPMFDVRTAVDVMATGSYSMMPSLNINALLPPNMEGGEDEAEVERHLDFIIRSQLLKTKVPSVCSSVHIAKGKLTLTVDSEYELCLSLKLEAPGRPWKVESIRILVRAKGYDDPTTDILVREPPPYPHCRSTAPTWQSEADAVHVCRHLGWKGAWRRWNSRLWRRSTFCPTSVA